MSLVYTDSNNVNYYSNTAGIAYVGSSTTASGNITILSQVPPGINTYTVESISVGAFVGCTSLTSVTIPNSVTSIGDQAFEQCNALTSVIIGNSVTSIGVAGFYDCTALTSVTIPNSVTNIGFKAFAICTALTSIDVDSGNPNYSSISGVLFNKQQDTLISYPNGAGSTYTIPDSVASIGGGGFYGCSALTSVTIPNSVTSIGDQAFAGCTSLTSVTIPNSVTSIGDQAFAGCTSLTSVTFESSPTLPTIGYAAFTTSPSTAYVKYTVNDVSALTSNGNSFTNIVYYGYPSVTCFKEDSKILTDKGYIPIQDLRKGDLVKTLLHGFKPIVLIGKRDIYHPASKERVKDQLYKCSHSEYSELNEDLVLTGCHSILVDGFISEEQRAKVIEVNGDTYVTNRKYRLPACADPRASVYEIAGTYTIYHLALENDDYYMNYGIFANGLLVETCSKRYLKELSNMELIE